MARVQYGRYETLGLIASGGMASVHLGRAVGPGGFERLVAIKVMHEHIAQDPEFSHMFLDEARLAARIRHPNVVPTLDVSEEGHVIVMEFVEGASLNQVLRHRSESGPEGLPLPVTLRVILDVLDGLHAAHELRERDGTPLALVHRDVSPHNVLVGVDGVSRITDFGIAYAESRLTSTRKGKLKGKMPYMAPEQLEGEEVDRRVDIYAAGCVLWEMLTGRRLFVAGNEAALACRILAGAEHSPLEMNEAVPPALSAACMRALEERDQRYLTALEFSEALEEAAQRSKIAVARPRAVSPFARRAMTSISSIIDAATQPEIERPPPTAPTRVGASAVTATATASPGGEDLPPAERPITVGDEPSGDSVSAPPVPPTSSAGLAETTRTDTSVVAPVLTRRRRGLAGWVLAATVATVITVTGAWLLFSATAPETEQAASPSASQTPVPSAAPSSKPPVPERVAAQPTSSAVEPLAAASSARPPRPHPAKPTPAPPRPTQPAAGTSTSSEYQPPHL